MYFLCQVSSEHEQNDRSWVELATRLRTGWSRWTRSHPLWGSRATGLPGAVGLQTWKVCQRSVWSNNQVLSEKKKKTRTTWTVKGWGAQYTPFLYPESQPLVERVVVFNVLPSKPHLVVVWSRLVSSGYRFTKRHCWVFHHEAAGKTPGLMLCSSVSLTDPIYRKAALPRAMCMSEKPSLKRRLKLRMLQ